MPPGYLISIVIVALPTLFAVFAPRRPAILGKLSFWLGIVINEVPFLGLYWIVGNSLPVSLAAPGVVLPALTAAGLLLIAGRGARARPVVAAALGVPLPRLGPRRLARILLWPFPTRPRSVERIANLRYGDAGRFHLLDVYCHRSRPAGAPVLVYWHGGGFFSGRKYREGLPLLHRFAEQGWVCINANYRLLPRYRFPDHLIDAKRVIAWARTNAHTYGGDPRVLVVSGGSAGGNMASMAALTPGDPRFQPGFEEADTSVSGVISLYGYYGPYYPHLLPAGAPPSAPADYARPDAPPFFVVHGDHDTSVAVSGARDFVAALRAVSSGPVWYAELPGAQHSFDLFYSLRFEAVIDGARAFAARLR